MSRVGRPPGGAARGRSADYVSRELNAATEADFLRLFGKHRGVWGGCWCMFYHIDAGWSARGYATNRREKRQRISEGRTHGVLVYDGSQPVGWCQFGPAAELPQVDRGRAYRSPRGSGPFWRITCFFVDRGHRRRGVAEVALRGALTAIRRRGGGTVEAYPTDSGPTAASFLWHGTMSMFARNGFSRSYRLGAHRWVVQRRIERSARPALGRVSRRARGGAGSRPGRGSPRPSRTRSPVPAG